MEKLLTYSQISEFAKKFPGQEVSSIAAAAIIGIKYLGEETLSHSDLWQIASSIQSNSNSILHLQNKLESLQKQIQKSKVPQETPRFYDENKKIRRASSLSRHKHRGSFHCHKHNMHSRKENSFLKNNEESEVVNIADKFLTDPLLSGLFKANPNDKNWAYFNHANIQNGRNRRGRRA